MQCVSPQKDLIRVVVDEEIQFNFACSLTGSGNVDKHLSVDEHFHKNIGHLNLDSEDSEDKSQTFHDVNLRTFEVVKRLDSLTSSSKSVTKYYQDRNLTALNDRYETLLLERRLRKAERISVHQFWYI